MLLFVGVLFVLLLLFCFNYVSQIIRLNNYVKVLPKIPVALLLPFLRPNKTSVEIFQCFEKIISHCNGMSTFWLGHQLVVFCGDPVNMKTILTSKNSHSKPYFYRFLSGFGDGVFTSNGHVWRSDRKNINTVFTLNVLKNFQPVLNRRFANFTRGLEKYVKQPEFDIEYQVYECMFDAFLETALRCDSIPKEWNKSKIYDNIFRAFQTQTLRTATLHMQPSLIYRLTNACAGEMKMVDHLNRHLREVFEKIIEQPKPPGDDSNTKPTALIDKLIEMERNQLIDRKRLFDQLNTFVIAGFETSSVTFLNTLLLLAIHQDVQERLIDEIRSTVTDCDSIDYDTVSKMEYLDRVLKESMRFLPVSYIWGREVDADIQLTDCTVPKGTVLILCLLKMHRDVKIWGPTANEFNPDHFLPEAVAQRHAFAFLPFSTGTRKCIGYQYAIISLKLMLCHFLLKYKVATRVRMSEIAFKWEILLKLNNKYKLTLEKR